MKNQITNLLLASISMLCLLQTATSQTLTVTLTTSNHNGFNISCFGGIDGSISATVTGGNAPYTYLWSNGATTQNIIGLASGYYNLVVKDFSGTISQRNEVTLTEPQSLKLTPSIYEYPNGYNISLYNAYNGSIAITITGGVTNYSYLWDDGTVTQNRASLGAGAYIVTVTDANACTVKSEQINLRQPDRSDWRMDGNNGSNPTTNFIGTKDSVDLSFRTNNTERFRIAGNGDLKIGKLAGNGTGLIYADVNGNLFKLLPSALPWLTGGNNTLTSGNNIIGTTNNDDFVIGTNMNGTGGEVMRVTATGQVGIGTANPQHKLEVANDLIRATHDNTGGATAGTIDIGYDGAHGIINASEELLINYYSGKSIQIGGDASVSYKPILKIGGSDLVLGNVDGRYQGSLTGVALAHDDISNGASFNDELVINYGGTYEGGVTLHGGITNNRITLDAIVGIGTFTPDQNYALSVCGPIKCTKLRVTTSWCDYVFNKNYNLMSLDKLENYIYLNNHLPGFEPAKKIESSGIEVSETITKMMEKIEELTLYVIELNKENKILKQQISGH